MDGNIPPIGDANAGQRDATADATSDSPDTGTLDAALPAAPKRTFVYVGGYGDNYPFESFELDRNSGALTSLGTVNLGASPSMIAKSANGQFLYVANEADGSNAGVTSAKIDRSTGKLTVGTHSSSEGAGLVFTEVSPDGKHLLATSYNAGKAFVYPIASDGSIGSFTASESFGGGAQTHCIRVHPNGQWVFAPNKGVDQVAQLSLKVSDGTLARQTPAAFATKAGAGPRHIVLSKDGSRAYLMNELDDTIMALSISSTGQLSALQTESTLPAGFDGNSNTGAHVLLRPDGKYVYASNRGHDSIAVFAVGADGKLTFVEHESTRGKKPRHFDIDARGELMVVANQDSGSLAIFRISADGKLAPLGDLKTGLTSPNTLAIVNID